jgi:hypothetical protein
MTQGFTAGDERYGQVGNNKMAAMMVKGLLSGLANPFSRSSDTDGSPFNTVRVWIIS